MVELFAVNEMVTGSSPVPGAPKIKTPQKGRFCFRLFVRRGENLPPELRRPRLGGGGGNVLRATPSSPVPGANKNRQEGDFLVE